MTTCSEMTTMDFSNRHAFHQQQLLQSFSALHPAHYQVLSNRWCVNSAIATSTGDIVPENLIRQVELVPERAYIIPETDLPRLEQPEAATTPIPTAVPKAKMVWKPGHGAIEKVDKFTGEIMHLVEERLNLMADAAFCAT